MSETPAGQVITFYSYKGGTGRSMSLANVAWVLAANGKRVLVADWDLDSPGLHRFFRPFLRVSDVTDGGGIVDMIRTYETEAGRKRKQRPPAGWHEEFAQVEQYAFSIDWEFPCGGTLDFLPAGRQNEDYGTLVSGLDWDDFYERLGGALFFDALRENMRRRYDYTLIDSRTGLSDVAQICTAHLPDVVVDCFTLSDQGIDGAASVARKVQQQRRRHIRVLPVPMRVDPAEKEKADAGRVLARRSFPDLPEGLDISARERYWNSIEVPYQAYYAYEETLATFGDAPGAPTSLLSAYEAVTSAITDGAVKGMPRGDVEGLPRMQDQVRLQWRRRYERRTDAPQSKVVLLYAVQDQVWAEWAQQVLEAVGAETVDRGPMESFQIPASDQGDVRPLCIVSSHFEKASEGVPGLWWDRHPHSLGIYPSGRREAGIRLTSTVNLSGLGPEEATQQLIMMAGRSDHANAGLAWKVARFPGREPNWFRLPVRNNRFTGRAEDLRKLRDKLVQADTAVALVALQGMGGVGKTQLALEYAYRFRSAYDLVWWISAEQPQFIDTAVIDLAHTLKLPTFPQPAETVRSTFGALRRGEPTDRWLIVFDNADAPESVLEALSQGKGQVLVTSRNQDWGARVTALDVDVFHRQESIQHLHTRLPLLPPEDADRVADALGDLPIAVDAAGAWLAETGTSVGEYLAELQRSTATLKPVDAMFRLSLDRLRSRSPAAHRLLEICSVMAPEIALDLLYSDQMAEALWGFAPSVSDRTERATLVRQLSKLSLLTLDVAGGQVQIHRVLQTFVREQIPADRLDLTRHQAHLVLSRNRPWCEVDDPQSWPRFRRLWPHLEIAQMEIAGCSDESVRQLLIDRVRYLSRRRDWALGLKFGTAVAAEWEHLLSRANAALENGPDSELRTLDTETLERQWLQLRFNLANILRDQSRFDEAFSIDESVLKRQTALLGPHHANTLMTAGGHAADLRARGWFKKAQVMDEETNQAWVEEFGEDHPRTLASANNLAVSCRALGDFRRARQHDEEVVRRRHRVLGPDNPETLHSRMCLGRDLREAGEYEQSVTMLREVRDTFRRTLGPDERGTLTAQTSLGVSLRSAGRAQEALEELDDALQRLSTHYGSDTPDTLACRMNRAENLLVLRQVVEATSELEAVVLAYERRLGSKHPFTVVSRSNLAAARRASGDLDGAQQLASEAVEGCEAALGADHPFTLAAAMNHATCLFETGQRAAAITQMNDATQRMSASLGVSDHGIPQV